ncbi:MAG: hypothetical protein HKO62_01565, partial [Gammaproteobacteria bacterium]|nr:hypothetical protein [Gammaproteobacteria bacterium]
MAVYIPTRFRIALLLAVGPWLLLIGGCNTQPATPMMVAERFWSAVEADDVRRIRRHILAAQAAASAGTQGVTPVTATQLGRTVIDGDNARIDTRVTLAADSDTEVALATVLVLEQGDWKVDYDRTMDSLARRGEVAETLAELREFGAALGEGISQSVEEFERALPEIRAGVEESIGEIQRVLPEIEQGVEQSIDAMRDQLPHIREQITEIEELVRDNVPALKSAIEQFIQDLEEALQTPPPT